MALLLGIPALIWGLRPEPGAGADMSPRRRTVRRGTNRPPSEEPSPTRRRRAPTARGVAAPTARNRARGCAVRSRAGSVCGCSPGSSSSATWRGCTRATSRASRRRSRRCSGSASHGPSPAGAHTPGGARGDAGGHGLLRRATALREPTEWWISLRGAVAAVALACLLAARRDTCRRRSLARRRAAGCPRRGARDPLRPTKPRSRQGQGRRLRGRAPGEVEAPLSAYLAPTGRRPLPAGG